MVHSVLGASLRGSEALLSSHGRKGKELLLDYWFDRSSHGIGGQSNIPQDVYRDPVAVRSCE